ncbi:hypothetical protein [Enterobacter cloacae]|nr:hypothetical protein [Enterobacter cloacae]
MNSDRQENTGWSKWSERGFVYAVVLLCIINYVYQLFRIFSA